MKVNDIAIYLISIMFRYGNKSEKRNVALTSREIVVTFCNSFQSDKIQSYCWEFCMKMKKYFLAERSELFSG